MNEIEKQFFECIGIEPKKLFSARQGINPDAVIYPEITDRKLLELFAIDNVTTYEELRNYILCRIIYNYENDENKRCQIKALFEDKEQ